MNSLAKDLEKVRQALDGLLSHLGPNGYIPSCGEPATTRGREALAMMPGLIEQAQRTGWQPIETAPRDGTVFVAVNARGNCRVPNPYFLCFSAEPPEKMTWSAEAGWLTPGRDWPCYPTHWMPLPAVPEAA